MTFFYHTQIKYKNIHIKDVHSTKYIRYARSAKLANLSSFLKGFTYFKNINNQITLEKNYLNYNKNLKSMSLLFLNQGLSSKELNKLRSNLKNVGITLTHLPTRF
jgi:hypothetical protein